MSQLLVPATLLRQYLNSSRQNRARWRRITTVFNRHIVQVQMKRQHKAVLEKVLRSFAKVKVLRTHSKRTVIAVPHPLQDTITALVELLQEQRQPALLPVELNAPIMDFNSGLTVQYSFCPCSTLNIFSHWTYLFLVFTPYIVVFIPLICFYMFYIFLTCKYYYSLMPISDSCCCDNE